MSSARAEGSFANAPLPENQTVSGWRVALIISSFNVALPGFLNGAQTGLALGLWQAVGVAFLAGLLLCAGACLTAIISVRTRLTTYLLIQRSFGIKGAAFVNLVVAVVHFCWFGVNVSFFGDAMVAADKAGYGLSGSFPMFVIIGSILITLSTFFGFRTLDRLALVAVPFVGIILCAVCWVALRDKVPDLAPVATPPVAMSFGIALSALIGGNMLTVAAMPDLSRFIRTERGAIAGMLLSFPTATPLLMLVSALIALGTGQTDIMALVTSMGFGIPALLMLLLSVWTINALNLYSGSLSLATTLPRVPGSVLILAGGAIGCLFALMGIINSFIPFLVALGVVIPPIASIYVIDGFMTFRNCAADEPAPSGFRWNAIAVWVGSVAVSMGAAALDLTMTTVPALDATIMAAAAYLLVLKIQNRQRQEHP